MSNELQLTYYESPVGELVIGIHNGKVCLCDWKHRKQRNTIDNRLQQGLSASMVTKPHPVAHTCINQLDEYFKGQRRSFELPIQMIGTDFQQQVWNLLLTIPYGKTETYHELSLKMNNTEAIRAVASANGANAISIIVPCHRVIGSDGNLTGYAGGLPAKRKLLLLEGVKLPGEQTHLFG